MEKRCRQKPKEPKKPAQPSSTCPHCQDEIVIPVEEIEDVNITRVLFENIL